MHNLKPAPIFLPPKRNLCPICGQASYSRDGIHPQCAVSQADQPRNIQLRLKKAKAKAKPAPRQSWKKKCPKCGGEMHIRLQKCACGHAFRSW